MNYIILQIDSFEEITFDKEEIILILKRTLPVAFAAIYKTYTTVAMALESFQKLQDDKDVHYVLIECETRDNSLLVHKFYYRGEDKLLNEPLEPSLLIQTPPSNKLEQKFYVITHNLLNLFAEKFYDKSKYSPLVKKKFVMTQFLINHNEIDFENFESNQDINYDVAYIYQKRIFDCGDASIEMLLNYHLQECEKSLLVEKLEKLSLFKESFDSRKVKSFKGKSINEIIKYSNYLFNEDFSSEPKKKEKLAFYLYKYGPLVVRTNDLGGHFLVVKGIYQDNIIIHDPWTRQLKDKSFDDFLKEWDGSVIYYNYGYSKYYENEKNQSSTQTASSNQANIG